jgi:heme-degrading monooxygenase HmoA
VIVRIWRTRVAPDREEEYERFTQEHSLPMFHQQKGLLGVLLLHGPEDRAALTMWESMAAVEALESSPTYAKTVHRLKGPACSWASNPWKYSRSTVASSEEILHQTSCIHSLRTYSRALSCSIPRPRRSRIWLAV